MSSFRAIVRRRQREAALRRMAGVAPSPYEREQMAADQVFAALERKWRVELRGRRIPGAVRLRMRNDRVFKEAVRKIMRGEPLVLDDMDHTPPVERAPDGSTRVRILEDFAGADPGDYFCPECGEEVKSPGAVCAECQPL